MHEFNKHSLKLIFGNAAYVLCKSLSVLTELIHLESGEFPYFVFKLKHKKLKNFIFCFVLDGVDSESVNLFAFAVDDNFEFTTLDNLLNCNIHIFYEHFMYDSYTLLNTPQYLSINLFKHTSMYKQIKSLQRKYKMYEYVTRNLRVVENTENKTIWLNLN